MPRVRSAAVWIAVVLARRAPDPFRTLLVVGGIYGGMLAITHQVLWSRAWGDDPPALGDRLAGKLPELIESIVLRGFSVGSSVVTGLAVGAIAGIIARAMTSARVRSM